MPELWFTHDKLFKVAIYFQATASACVHCQLPHRLPCLEGLICIIFYTMQISFHLYIQNAVSTSCMGLDFRVYWISISNWTTAMWLFAGGAHQQCEGRLDPPRACGNSHDWGNVILLFFFCFCFLLHDGHLTACCCPSVSIWCLNLDICLHLLMRDTEHYCHSLKSAV